MIIDSIFLMDQLNTVLDEHEVGRSIKLDEPPTINILHVEDDETIAAVARELLEARGWDVESCSDGMSAIEKISSEVHYDFLLIDPDLPDLNGLELVCRARTLAHRSRIAIGVLSANSVEAEAREAGADVFLRKPQHILSLPETITRLLSELKESDS